MELTKLYIVVKSLGLLVISKIPLHPIDHRANQLLGLHFLESPNILTAAIELWGEKLCKEHGQNFALTNRQLPTGTRLNHLSQPRRSSAIRSSPHPFASLMTSMKIIHPLLVEWR